MIVSGIGQIPTGLERSIDIVHRHVASFARHNTLRKSFNICSLYVHRMLGRCVLGARPCEVIVEPTNVCTLSCPLCPTGQRANGRRNGMMKWETYQRIVDELSPWLYRIRLYNWGEPLLHPDIYRMISYARQKNIGTELSSNLNVTEPADAQKLVESGLELLIVSLDGADAATYGEYRVGGDFDKVCRNVKAIAEARRRLGSRYPLIEIQCLIMRDNEHQRQQMVTLSRSMGADRLRFGPVTINVLNESDWRWLPSSENLSRYSYGRRRDRVYSHRRRCEWLWRSAVFNWDGTVSPCCVYEGPKSEMGVLGERPFEEIWNGPGYVEARRGFTRHGKHEVAGASICSHCRGTPLAVNEDQNGLY
jgi:MoaA/NifB/PqqE/SkfB family radical SAM enzyme